MKVAIINPPITAAFSPAHYYPTILILNACKGKMSLLNDRKKNPFLRYYREKLIPEIKSFQPDLIGISYNYRTQFLPGLSLTSEIEHRLGAPVVVGGSFFSILCKQVVAEEMSQSFQLEFSQNPSAIIKGIQKAHLLKSVKSKGTQIALALLISQSIFAPIHIPIRVFTGMPPLTMVYSVLTLFFYGTVFALIYCRTGNLFVAVGIHTLHNNPASLFLSKASAFNLLYPLVLIVLLLWPWFTNNYAVKK